jgi:hypothetical protein
MCASGARATLAASVLARMGFDARPLVHGGANELAHERATLAASA